jgi:PKD repeat protein
VEITEWKGEYFNNRNLEGEPALVRNDAEINFDWTGQSPAPEIPPENFSVRWTISRELPAGIYRFNVWVDDGVRMWVDEELIIDGWQEGAIQNFSVDVSLDQGTHQARVEYFQAVGTALIQLEIGSVEPPTDGPPVAVISGPTQAEVGQPITFDASNSQSANPIVSYLWDFGDGTTANLTVVDDKDQQGSDTTQIAIGEPLPGGTPTIPPPEATAPIPEVTPPEATLTAPVPELTTPPPEATTLPPEAITPSPELTPTLGSGGGGALTALIIAIVRDGALQAIFTPGQTVVVAAGQPVEFDGSGSQAGVSEIVSYNWSFGDGGTAAEPVVSHTYAAPANYTASLTVTDATGASNTATSAVQVYGEESPTPES